MNQAARITAAASFVLAVRALAGAPDALAPEPASEWQWRIGMPLWVGVPTSGDASTGGINVEVDTDAEDLIDVIDMAAALSIEARRGPWSFMADGMFVRVSDGVSPDGLAIASAGLELEQMIVNAAVGYRFLNNDTWVVDGVLGARYNHLGMTLEVDYNPDFLGDTRIEGSQSWIDPFVGIGLRAKLSEALTFVTKADVGGFGVGSDSTWQAYAGLECRVTESMWAGFGWKHLHTDYSDGGFGYNVNMSGPVLELGMSF
jgi:hypothetical protein